MGISLRQLLADFEAAWHIGVYLRLTGLLNMSVIELSDMHVFSVDQKSDFAWVLRPGKDDWVFQGRLLIFYCEVDTTSCLTRQMFLTVLH